MPEQTVVDIEQQYNTAIEKAKGKPDVLAQLQIEKTAAITQAKLRDVGLRELALAKREALLEFPLAKEVEEHVVGDSEEAVKASAQQWHTRLSKLIETRHREIEVHKLVEQQLNSKPPEAGSDGDVPAETVQQ